MTAVKMIVSFQGKQVSDSEVLQVTCVQSHKTLLLHTL